MATHYVLTVKKALGLLINEGLGTSYHRQTRHQEGHKYTQWYLTSGDLHITTGNKGQFSYMYVRATCPAVAQKAAYVLAKGTHGYTAKPKQDYNDSSAFSFQVSTFRGAEWYMYK